MLIAEVRFELDSRNKDMTDIAAAAATNCYCWRAQGYQPLDIRSQLGAANAR
jgi:hypothetical protein